VLRFLHIFSIIYKEHWTLLFYEKRTIRIGCNAGLGVKCRHANRKLYTTSTRTKGNTMRPQPSPVVAEWEQMEEQVEWVEMVELLQVANLQTAEMVEPALIAEQAEVADVVVLLLQEAGQTATQETDMVTLV
jgi:hypothetical protein